MDSFEQITQIICDAIGEVNESLEPEQKTLDTVLLGESQILDSLGLVNLVVTVEQKIERTLKKKISLFDVIMADDQSQLTVGTLAQHIVDIVGGNASDQRQAQASARL